MTVKLKNSVFYGWINVAVLWICYLMIMGSIIYTFGIVVVPMANDLKISMTLATAAYSGFNLSTAIMSIWMGKFIAKYGTKKSIIFGSASMIIGSLLMAFVVKNYILYFIVWTVFFSIGVRFATTSPGQINISKWFYKKRGFAMAIFLTSGGIAGFIFSPLINKIVTLYTWRHAWLLIAFCSGIAMLLTMVLLKENPEDIGEVIDGNGVSRTPEFSNRNISKKQIHKSVEPWTIVEVRKELSFYQISFAQLAVNFLMIAVSTQAVNHMVNLGLPKAIGASVLGTFSLINTSGRLIVGTLSDKIDTKKLLMIGTIIASIGMLILMRAQSVLNAYAFSVFAGVGFGICIICPPNMIVNYFGINDYSNINAYFNLVTGIIGGLSAVIIGIIYDLTGSYNLVWLLTVAILIITCINMIFIKPPKLYKE